MYLRFAVYILQCSNATYYTGFTTNIGNRLKAHSKGKVIYTKDKLPIKLVHLSYFKNKCDACNFERYLKTGSGIAFRNKRLIRFVKN
ncbi:MAG: GIY-YIG nuclease family protein [Bacteroidia bacterium]|nr:GIY-YIG nuclease family protein [Bacteroidia bacterium]MBT8278328.1 GIY-YIG nuclease family protein [Bacteroidia bacterium]NNK60075.1 GIY-YIG nuclease family protein [Flavobacteriaceae bacterium]NNL31879.1 GIY-YIG nuclease family protein [Flavobacteriaceae bacterium]